jgi:hypothetical protein
MLSVYSVESEILIVSLNKARILRTYRKILIVFAKPSALFRRFVTEAFELAQFRSTDCFIIEQMRSHELPRPQLCSGLIYKNCNETAALSCLLAIRYYR